MEINIWFGLSQTNTFKVMLLFPAWITIDILTTLQWYFVTKPQWRKQRNDENYECVIGLFLLFCYFILNKL